MRLLEYRQDLVNHGYTVIGGDMHYEALMEEECRPIRMTNMSYLGEPTNCVENLVDAVDEDWDNEQEKTDFFLANYADILRGKYPEWQIISFHVAVGRICLDFYNYKTKETGYLCMSVEQQNRIEVRFDTPSVCGGPDAMYLVSFSYFNGGQQRTQVIEYTGLSRREIDFFFKDPEKTDPFSDEQYVEIAEYTNL